MPATTEGILWTKEGLREGLTTDAVVPSSPNIRDEYDVIVVGAGWAGLTAARNISEQSKLSVLVVEARDRIGGRTWTAKEFGQEFEMGGNWVLWTQPHIWTELHRYGMQKDIVASSGTTHAEKTYWKSRDGTSSEIGSIKDGGNQFNTLETIAQDFFKIDGHNSKTLMPMPHNPFCEPAPWKNYDHLTVTDRLNQLKSTGKYDDADLEMLEIISNGTGLTQASERSFTEFLFWFALGGYTISNMADAMGVYKIKGGGMTKLALQLLGDYKGDLAMNSIVRSISQIGDNVNVELHSRRVIRARKVISTIPLNCLSLVKFNPPLQPKKQQASAIGQINKGLKFHFKTSGTMSSWNAFVSPKGNSGFSHALSDHIDGKESYSLTFAYAESNIDVRNDRQVVSEYSSIFPPEAQPEVTGYLSHDWKNDPFAKGAWCAFGPSFMKDYQQELQKDHGSVIFASADWADGWRSFVDGAIGEGIDAARKVMANLRVPLRTRSNV